MWSRSAPVTVAFAPIIAIPILPAAVRLAPCLVLLVPTLSVLLITLPLFGFYSLLLAAHLDLIGDALKQAFVVRKSIGTVKGRLTPSFACGQVWKTARNWESLAKRTLQHAPL